MSSSDWDALLNSNSPIRRHRQREPKVVVGVGAPPARGTESPVFRVREKLVKQ